MDAHVAKALELHQKVPVIDTHTHFLLAGYYLRKRFERPHRPPLFWNPLRNTVDMPRMRQGRIACLAFTVYVPPPPLRVSAWRAAQNMLDFLDRTIARNASEMIKVHNARGIVAAHRQQKLAALPAVEGGHVIGNDADRITNLRERGVRLLTLTHFIPNRICDAHVGPAIHGGLSDFGKEVLAVCRHTGVVVDLAHASEKAFFQVLERLDKPPVVTHAALREHGRSQRYMKNDQIRELASAGGCLGVLMCPWYQQRIGIAGSLDRAADVYCRLADLVGPEHLMIGTDMDGFTWLPRGMRDAADLPRLTAKLLERGFTASEIEGILGGNFLRVLAQWE